MRFKFLMEPLINSPQPILRPFRPIHRTPSLDLPSREGASRRRTRLSQNWLQSRLRCVIQRLLILLLFPLALFAEEEIVVQLETEKQMIPVYMAPWKKSDSSKVTTRHLQELMGVMLFDFDNNGATEIVHSNAARAAQNSKDSEEGFDATAWRKLGIHYLIRGTIKGETLHIRGASIATGQVVAAYSLKLTGSLARDRQRIHVLSDAIYEIMFGKPGVASTKLLYTIRDPKPEGGWQAEVWACDYDGANARQITSEGDYCVTPTYMPPAPGATCGSFFYVSYKNGQPKIYRSTLDGKLSQQFTSLRGSQLMPMVSPKRDLVAFVCDAPGNADLFVQSFDPESGPVGKPRQIFSAPRGTQASPTFSPDGSQIAFVSNKDGPPRIYVMDVPTTVDPVIKPRILSKRNPGNTSPAWSPDGHKLAYSAKTSGVRQIWIYDFETDTERQLTCGRGHKENPTWAPDSLHLIFNSATDRECQLYLINLNQAKATPITSGTGEKRFPAWEPSA